MVMMTIMAMATMMSDGPELAKQIKGGFQHCPQPEMRNTGRPMGLCRRDLTPGSLTAPPLNRQGEEEEYCY